MGFLKMLGYLGTTVQIAVLTLAENDAMTSEIGDSFRLGINALQEKNDKRREEMTRRFLERKRQRNERRERAHKSTEKQTSVSAEVCSKPSQNTNFTK